MRGTERENKLKIVKKKNIIMVEGILGEILGGKLEERFRNNSDGDR